MNFRSRLIQGLRRDIPGSRYVYTDQSGHMRIGMHRAVDPRIDGGLSDAEIVFLLNGNLDAIETEMRSLFPYAYRLKEARTAVLIDLAFGTFGGVIGLTQQKSLLDPIMQSKYEEAANVIRAIELARHRYHRSERLGRMMESGVWPEEWKDSR